MMACITVQQPAYHPLVLCAIFCGLLLKEFDATLGERNRHLHAFLTKRELFRGRQTYSRRAK